MSRLHFLLSLFVCFLWFTSCGVFRPTEEKPFLRVMTYNIHHGEGVDGTIDIRRIARLIKDSGADVVALQEVDRGVERTNKIDIIVMLSDLTGMTYAFGKNIDYQGGDYGNAFLTRYPIIEERNHHYTMFREGEQRGLLQLMLEVKGQEIVVMNTHLDYRADDAERLTSVAELLAASERYAPRSIIACGDFNDVPPSPTIARMKERFIDCWDVAGSEDGWTYPTTQPSKRIDYIFVSKPTTGGGQALRPVRAWVIHSNASDHLPLVVDFEISNK